MPLQSPPLQLSTVNHQFTLSIRSLTFNKKGTLLAVGDDDGAGPGEDEDYVDSGNEDQEGEDDDEDATLPTAVVASDGSLCKVKSMFIARKYSPIVLTKLGISKGFT
ncbi:hypothetical protein GUJ93_ZPchr0014g46822 [Zizania palustris]|uniref:Uncharacterized protein n=1 Tax=Zizania palustris TaxID=103762 RepID=A0A8J5W6R2_ZIZPA|nr:hypothetical protein GUJ93_ZPchr0014g46822 [Zizania palustris]